jgi:glucokinase
MTPTHLTSRILFEYLQMRDAATIPEIATRLQVPAPTITGLLSRLVARGLVSRSEPLAGRRGRPRVTYRLRLPTMVPACHWDGTQLSGALFDQDMNARALSTIDLTGVDTLAAALKQIDRLLADVLDQSGVRRDQLPGLALSLNAVSIAGQAVTSSVVPWANESLGQALADALRLPVRILLNAPIIAEYRKLPEPAPHSMCLLKAGDGVSAHAIEAGQRLLGRHSLAGELGHMTIEERGPLCGCGRRGCLETRCSGPSIHRRALEDLRQGVNSELRLLELEAMSPRDAIERIWQAWQNGDTFTHALMDPVFEALAWGFGVVVNLLDPDTIIAGGYVLKDHPQWIAEIERRAQRLILHAAKRQNLLAPAQATVEDELRVAACGFHPQAVPDELVMPKAPPPRAVSKMQRSSRESEPPAPPRPAPAPARIKDDKENW